MRFSNYNDRLQQLKLESLQSRRIKNDLILLYKILNSLVDMQFTDYFKFSNFSRHNLHRHNLHLVRTKPAKNPCRQNFFSMRVIEYWNKLPTNTVTSPSLSIFKHRLKTINFSFWLRFSIFICLRYLLSCIFYCLIVLMHLFQQW